MATKLILRKLGTSLVAQDRNVIDDVLKIKEGSLVVCEVKRPRSVEHLRLFFALVRLIWDNCDTDRYPNEEDLRAALTISAGHRLRIELPNGEVGFAAKSISFENMDQIQFNEFYERVCDAVHKHFVPGLESDAIRREIEMMTGGRIG